MSTHETETDDGEQTSVPLGALHENDYNPRRDTGDVASLRESIREEGLLQPPLVRPLNGGGEYEVVAGERRLAALRGLYDDDHRVGVTVREMTDEEAEWAAIKENVERRDLTPIEEGRAFAQKVTRTVCVDCGGAVVYANQSIHDGHDTKEVSFAEYVSLYRQSDIVGDISIPTDDASGVADVAERIGQEPSYIADRLAFITLPDDVQTLVEMGDRKPSDRPDSATWLPKRAARKLARIDIDDPEARDEAIREIANDGRFNQGMGNDAYPVLESAIEAAEDEYEQAQNAAKEAVESYRRTVADAYNDLHDGVTDALDALGNVTDDQLTIPDLADNEEYDELPDDSDLDHTDAAAVRDATDVDVPDEIPTDDEGAVTMDADDAIARARGFNETAETIIGALGDAQTLASGRATVFRGRRTDVKQAKSRAEQAVVAFGDAAHDPDDGCPYCGSEIEKDALTARRDVLDDAVSDLREQIDTQSAVVRDLTDETKRVGRRQNTLDGALDNYDEAFERLRAEQDGTDADGDTDVDGEVSV